MTSERSTESKIVTLTDEELVMESKKNGEMFIHLMRRYEPKLLRYVRRLSGLDGPDGEDILQNSFLKTYQHLNDFDQQLKFSSWIYRITRNETIDYLRKRKVKTVSLDDDGNDENFKLAETLASDLDVAREVEREILGDKIRRALTKLKEQYRTVLVLRYLEEKEYLEIADIMRLPMGTVATMISRAKKQLQKVIIEMNIS
ncbi:MAG: sigma-70 family RNA polymerase sigma factor [bacterium]